MDDGGRIGEEGGVGRTEERDEDGGREEEGWTSATKLRSPDTPTPSQNNPKIYLEKRVSKSQIPQRWGVGTRARSAQAQPSGEH